jgi:GT2 family glycosyltransferase
VPSGNPRTVVVGVLTWNGYEKARACVESLATLDDWPLPVLVVDNGSTEPEGERIAREFGSPVVALRLTPNQGVAGGYNAALSGAAALGATHVLLLNNDTLVTDPQMLARLVTAAEPDVAAVGPVVLNFDRTVFSAGGTLSWATGRTRHRHHPRVSDEPHAVAWLDGPCLLVSIAAVRRIGGLDPIFVSYWEDIDWCVRAQRAGYRCLLEPRTSIIHLRGGTIPSPEARAFSLRNSLLFLRRNGSTANTVTGLAFFLAVRIPFHLVRHAWPPSRIAPAIRSAAHAVMWHVRDTRRRGWRLGGDGPELGEMRGPMQPAVDAHDGRLVT